MQSEVEILLIFVEQRKRNLNHISIKKYVKQRESKEKIIRDRVR